MAFKPFTGKLGVSGKEYYAAALQSHTEQATYSSGGQSIPDPYGHQLRNIGLAGLGIGAVIRSGMIKTGGTNVFSKYYMSTIRGIEEFSPGKILRTMQVGNLLSQFSDQAKITRIITGQTLHNEPALQEFLTRTTGRIFGAHDVRAKGIMFHEGKLYHPLMENGVYRPGELIAGHASVIRNTYRGASRISEGISMASGMKVKAQRGLLNINGGQGLFSKLLPFHDINGKLGKDSFQISVAESARKQAGLQARGIAAAGVERFNLLSRELPAHVVGMIDHVPGVKLGNLLERYGVGEKVLHGMLGTKPGSALKTLGHVSAKWALVGGGLYFGYDLLDKTLNRVGLSPTKIAARTYVGGRLTAAKLGQISGASYLAKKQEEIAPGSTSLTKLSAFPLMGGLAGGSLHYLQRMNLQTNMLRRGVPLERLGAKADMVMNHLSNHQGWFKNLSRWIEKGEHFKGLRSLVTHSPLRLKMAIGAGAGLAAILPFLPGALAPQKSSGELADIYSGRKNIAVKKGRWWELGRSPLEGSNTQYFRPHWFPLLMSDARDKSIYGGATSALSKFYQANFTYNLERKHFFDRPYPIAGSAFEDVPLIGPILAATVGRLIKPPIKMHTNEYKQGGDYLYQPPGFGKHTATEMGEVGQGSPINPYGIRATISNQFTRMTEMVGLWGFFARSSLKGAIGQDSPFSEEARLQSSRTMFGMTRNVWDRDLGGGGPIGEVLRRVFPHPNKEIPEYNPISNTMPSWLPGPGERAQDFQHGDPYAKITMGDVRLPGAGYEALHPELAGLDPEDYPDVWKFRVLSDVAPYADKTQMLENQLGQMKKGGSLSDQEIAIFERSKEETKELRNKREFNEYQYEGKMPLTPWGMLGKYWEKLSHGANTPLEFFTPISPFHKLIHQQTTIEDYEDNVLYGKQASFWNKPIENFIKPTAMTGLNSIGLGGAAGSQSEVRSIEQYFDALKYIKYTRLRDYAVDQNDYNAVGQFEEKRHETLAGVNPYTQTYSYIFRALPRRDRDYFTAFSEENDPEKREKILSMLPQNERGLMMARWRTAKSQDLQNRKRKGEVLSRDAENFISETYELGKGDGVPKSEELYSEFIKDRESGEQYPDWYRRTKVLPIALDGKPLPGPDWVGWHPSVDLNDIKLKVVQNLGHDMHDFDLWQSDEQQLARRPFINTQAAEAADPHGHMSEQAIRSTLQELLGSHGVEDHDISVTMYPSQKTQYNVDLHLTQDRSEEAKKVMDRGI